MVMRKYQNDYSVGVFLGSIVATSHFFLLLSLIYFGYAGDRKAKNLSIIEEIIQGLMFFAQSLVLGLFAIILGAHRSRVLDNKESINNESIAFGDTESTDYQPPTVMK